MESIIPYQDYLFLHYKASCNTLQIFLIIVLINYSQFRIVYQEKHSGCHLIPYMLNLRAHYLIFPWKGLQLPTTIKKKRKKDVFSNWSFVPSLTLKTHIICNSCTCKIKCIHTFGFRCPWGGAMGHERLYTGLCTFRWARRLTSTLLGNIIKVYLPFREKVPWTIRLKHFSCITLSS